MKFRNLVAAFVLGLFCSGTALALSVITDRTPTHVKPIFEAYQKLMLQRNPTFTLDVTYVEEGALPQRLNPVNIKNYDFILTQDSTTLQPLTYVAATPQIISYRIRGFAAVKDPGLNYEDLATLKENQLCIRPLNHAYNINMLAQLYVVLGEAKVKQIITNLKTVNDGKFVGNDRQQVLAMQEGKCSVAMLNSYYMGMLHNSEHADKVKDVNFYVPGITKTDRRAIALYSAALSRTKDGDELLSFFKSHFVREYLRLNLYEFVSTNDYNLLALNPGDVNAAKLRVLNLLQ